MDILNIDWALVGTIFIALTIFSVVKAVLSAIANFLYKI